MHDIDYWLRVITSTIHYRVVVTFHRSEEGLSAFRRLYNSGVIIHRFDILRARDVLERGQPAWKNPYNRMYAITDLRTISDDDLRLALVSITRIFHQGKLRVLLDSDHEKRKAKVESFCLLIGMNPLWVSQDIPESYVISVDWRENRDTGFSSHIMTCKVEGRASGRQVCVHLDTLTGALWGEGLPIGSVLYSDEDSFVRVCLRLIETV